MDGEHESIGARVLREHAESLTVGTRVRVRLGGECQFPHESWQNGHPGIVDHHYTGLAPDRNHQHSVAVHLAGDFSRGDGVHPGGLPRFTYFATTELIPLAEDDA